MLQLCMLPIWILQWFSLDCQECDFYGLGWVGEGSCGREGREGKLIFQGEK